MDAFVLSLEASEARRAPLLGALSALGIVPRLHLGIDGRKGLPSAAEAMLDRNEANRRAKRVVTDGEFACALSHLAIYRTILEQGFRLAVVLEDDAILTDAFLETVMALKGRDFDIALLDHELARSHWSAEFALPGGARAWRVTNIPDRNTGYMVTANAARYILENSFPVRYLADWPCDISTLMTVAVKPNAVLRPRGDEASLLSAERRSSQTRAAWGNPTPPFSDTSLTSRLQRLFSRRIS